MSSSVRKHILREWRFLRETYQNLLSSLHKIRGPDPQDHDDGAKHHHPLTDTHPEFVARIRQGKESSTHHHACQREHDANRHLAFKLVHLQIPLWMTLNILAYIFIKVNFLLKIRLKKGEKGFRFPLSCVTIPAQSQLGFGFHVFIYCYNSRRRRRHPCCS